MLWVSSSPITQNKHISRILVGHSVASANQAPFWDLGVHLPILFFNIFLLIGGHEMGCKTHRGERGGRYTLKRKKGGGTKRVYLQTGEKAPR